MPTLIQEIEAQIAQAKTTPTRRNVGVIREIGDGVAKVDGLTDVMLMYVYSLRSSCLVPRPPCWCPQCMR